MSLRISSDEWSFKSDKWPYTEALFEGSCPATVNKVTFRKHLPTWEASRLVVEKSTSVGRGRNARRDLSRAPKLLGPAASERHVAEVPGSWVWYHPWFFSYLDCEINSRQWVVGWSRYPRSGRNQGRRWLGTATLELPTATASATCR